MGVRLALDKGQLGIEADNPDLGNAREKLEVDYKGGAVQVGFNARYFIDLLTEMDTPEVKVELAGELDPAVVRPGDGTDYLGVIMPMRLVILQREPARLRAAGATCAPVALEPGPRATVLLRAERPGQDQPARGRLLPDRVPLVPHQDRGRAGPLGRAAGPRWRPRSRSAGSTGASTSSSAPGRKLVRVDGKARAPRRAAACAGWGWWCSCPRTCCCRGPRPPARRSFLDRAAYNVDRAVLRRGGRLPEGAAQPERRCCGEGGRPPCPARHLRRGAGAHRRPAGDAAAGHLAAALAPAGAGAVRRPARRPRRPHPLPQCTPSVEAAGSEAEVAEALRGGPGARRGAGPAPRLHRLWSAHRRPRDRRSAAGRCANTAPRGSCARWCWRSKLAELANLAAALGEPPLLLLDDVASELDERPPAQAVRDHRRTCRARPSSR